MERSREKAQLEIVLQHFVIPARALAEGNWQMVYTIGMDNGDNGVTFELLPKWFCVVCEVPYSRLSKCTVSSTLLRTRTWLTTMPQMDTHTCCPKPIWRIMGFLPTGNTVERVDSVLFSTTFPTK